MMAKVLLAYKRYVRLHEKNLTLGLRYQQGSWCYSN